MQRQDTRLGRSARSYLQTRALRPHPKYLKQQGSASSEPSGFQVGKEVAIWQTCSGLPKSSATPVESEAVPPPPYNGGESRRAEPKLTQGWMKCKALMPPGPGLCPDKDSTRPTMKELAAPYLI